MPTLHSGNYPKYGKHYLDYYFIEEFCERITTKRFKIAQYHKGIRLQNIHKAPSTPDDLLQTVIEHLIEEARDEKVIDGKKADRFSLVFRSSVLERPIYASD